MKRIPWIVVATVAISSISPQHTGVSAQARPSGGTPTYLGFDRNVYPGDDNLKLLRQTFSYAGFWLNRPPGETVNTWAGKRLAMESVGFGFLVLFNGRLFTALKTVANAGKLGRADAQAAIAAARREGFPAGTVIFLDQEEGGRMLPEQKAYIYVWVDEVTAAGFRSGIYCSGIGAKEDGGIVTADDVRQNAAGRRIVFWVTNDACPPSPGCAYPPHPPSPADSGVKFAEVWQYAQSPKREEVASACPKNYHRDGSCYPPGFGPSRPLHVDLNTAADADPSRGRTQ
jgi:hypothetical protein